MIDRRNLSHQAVEGLIKFAVAMAALLFVPAWTLRYWQGWLFLGVFCGACIASTFYFLRHDPKLIERRMSAGPAAEREPTQKIIMGIASVCFLLLVVVPGLDHRWHWSEVPAPLVFAGNAIVVTSFLLVGLVLRQNSYAASTIRVEQNQPVISTGAYAVVRHPMYAAALPMFIGTPLALGSYWALFVLIPMVPALLWRLIDEEQFLKVHLPGYVEYCCATRYRLIPLLW